MENYDALIKESETYVKLFDSLNLSNYIKNDIVWNYKINLVLRKLVSGINDILCNRELILFEEYKHLVDICLYEMKVNKLIDDYDISINGYGDRFTMKTSIKCTEQLSYNCQRDVLETPILKLVKDPNHDGFVRLE